MDGDIELHSDLPLHPLLDHVDKSKSRNCVWQGTSLSVVLAISIILNVVLLLHAYTLPLSPDNPSPFYSPVQDQLTYHPRRFTVGLGNESTIYQDPPSTAKKTAWDDLYVKAMRLTASEAERLPNKTASIVNSSNYAIGLSVFHNLHCLHYISKNLDILYHPEYFGLENPEIRRKGSRQATSTRHGVTGGLANEVHTGHCVDMLRQALMCNADISTTVWQTNRDGFLRPAVDTMHICADYAALLQWANERRLDGVLELDGTKTAGRCGGQDEGCGEEEYGDEKWRDQNKWMDAGM